MKINLNSPIINAAISSLEAKLLAGFNPVNGYWTGQLSSSALSTAVAVFALAQVDISENRQTVGKGLKWLAVNQNQDGGWGDTPGSISNLSTTLLVISAFTLDVDEQYVNRTAKAEVWLKSHIGSVSAENIVSALLANYGNDKTFSVPILTMCALAGLLDEDNSEPWKRVPQLPFELAILPHSFFKFLNLSVVSYALPALIAIGILRHRKLPSFNFILRGLRNSILRRVLTILQSKQPANGGFLEATPLTGFVVMSLAAGGYKDNPVLKKGVEFLLTSIRPDGSWPIDSNLSVWVTTLSVNALTASAKTNNTAVLSDIDKMKIRDWLLARQFKSIHPYTCAAPGGWGWTELPGGVPDADDTSGALLALKTLDAENSSVEKAASAGIFWLINLQNRDGGIPTFCRGWGKLPFDKSCPDITAHAFAAILAWYNRMDDKLQCQMLFSLKKMVSYLLHSQREDGTWVPLWFGNQYSTDRKNPVFGTSRVISCLEMSDIPSGIDPDYTLKEAMKAGIKWLLSVQNQNGGWGGSAETPSSIEETAMAISALSSRPETRNHQTIIHGVDWLITETNKVADTEQLPSSPIGLYFASLWYDEKLYPLVFAIDGLKKAVTVLRS